MTDVTQILSEIESGDSSAAEKLLPLVYEELRRLAAQRMAGESPDHTLQATALVHEAYVRLVEVEKVQHWNSRVHFFGAAAEAMRRILVENARRKKHRHCRANAPDSDMQICDPGMADSDFDVLAVDEALTRLAQQHPQKAELVKLRFFAGLTLAETAETLALSGATVDRYWKYARAWLSRELCRGPGGEEI